jgi:hypothetical protein
MAVAPRISYGNLPADVSLLDEPNMLVQSLVTTPSRTKTSYKGANRCTAGLEFTDPLLTFAFDAFVSTRTGLSEAHPGSQVVELANFDAARFGFDPAEGILVYEDPVSTQNLDNPEAIKFNVVHYPFITA